MSTNLDNNEFDNTHDEGVSAYPGEQFPAPSDVTAMMEHDPSVYNAPTSEHADAVAVEPETNEYGVTRATEEDGDEKPVVAEGISEHRPGESLGEWLRNDLERTKADLADLYIGGASKDSS